MAFDLFGFTVSKKQTKKTFVTPENDDGAITYVEGGGFVGTYLNTDIDAKDENLLIQKYREMAMTQEVDLAITDVVNEAVLYEGGNVGNTTVALSLDTLQQSVGIKKKIIDEFKKIVSLLDFNKTGYDTFRKWYIDGKLYHHIIIDNNKPREGIKHLIPVDALDIKKVREIKREKDPVSNIEYTEDIEEYFLYKPDQTTGQFFPHGKHTEEIKVAPDSISYVHSGMIDSDKQVVIGYLYKAIKPYNQLRMIEDSLVIYRLARAPERRIFYIDVGNLPKLKAEQYLRSVMDKYKQKVVYNATTGEVEDQKKQMSMLEDFWLPRREGGRGTEINTLPSGQNLGEIEDIEYFRKKLYQSLNVPISRIEGTESTAFNLGRTSEINRDEIKFAKFISRLRQRFSSLFTDLLRIQLLLKGIIKEEDWTEIKDAIEYVWTQDSHYVELKDNEILRERLEVLSQLDEYIGKYFSNEWVRKNLLRQTDEEIKQLDKEIKRETGEDPDDAEINPDLLDFQGP
tara:strand:- start:3894 stop:5429 length:1536 start_codon:yes stop_codon:yes gene_type:complete